MLPPNVRASDVRRLLRTAESLELSAGAIQRLKWYAYALDHDRNVSLTCRHFGIARSTFLRWAERFDPRNPSTLEEISRKPHHVRKPETDERAVELIRALRMQHPTMGKVGIAELLEREHGVHLSVSTVGRVIARHNLFFADTDSHAEKRHALETKDITVSIEIAPDQKKPHDETSGETALAPLPAA